MGQSIRPAKRKKEHFDSLNCDKHYNEYLQRSFNKHGSEAFCFFILEKCDDENLNKRELHYINKLKTHDRSRGYNLRGGGDYFRLSDDSKRKISETRKQRISSGEIKTMKGYKWSEETRKRVKEEKRLLYSNPEFRKGIAVKLSIIASTIPIEVVADIKELMKQDRTVEDISKQTGVKLSIINHIYYLKSHTWVKPELNYYISNRQEIWDKKRAASCLKLYRENETYQNIANINNIHIRTAMRIIQKNKNEFDDYMRGCKTEWEKNKRNRMIKMMFKQGWTISKISRHFKTGRNQVTNCLRS